MDPNSGSDQYLRDASQDLWNEVMFFFGGGAPQSKRQVDLPALVENVTTFQFGTRRLKRDYEFETGHFHSGEAPKNGLEEKNYTWLYMHNTWWL